MTKFTPTDIVALLDAGIVSRAEARTALGFPAEDAAKAIRRSPVVFEDELPARVVEEARTMLGFPAEGAVEAATAPESDSAPWEVSAPAAEKPTTERKRRTNEDIAREHGVNLEDVKTWKGGGRITKADIAEFAKLHPAAAAVEAEGALSPEDAEIKARVEAKRAERAAEEPTVSPIFTELAATATTAAPPKPTWQQLSQQAASSAGRLTPEGVYLDNPPQPGETLEAYKARIAVEGVKGVPLVDFPPQPGETQETYWARIEAEHAPKVPDEALQGHDVGQPQPSWSVEPPPTPAPQHPEYGFAQPMTGGDLPWQS